MLVRLDEIGENYENLKAKVISYTTNKAEQARGGQRETSGADGSRSRERRRGVC